MNKERLWFGTGMVVVPLLFVVAALGPSVQATPGGVVEGHVTFHGRPLVGGSILFVPEDRHDAWALAWIDEKGDYVIGSVWARKASSGKTRYRICVIPDSHGRVIQAMHRMANSAWSGPGDAAFPPPDTSSGFPAQLCSPKTTGLQVLLGTEPARVDVTL